MSTTPKPQMTFRKRLLYPIAGALVVLLLACIGGLSWIWEKDIQEDALLRIRMVEKAFSHRADELNTSVDLLLSDHTLTELWNNQDHDEFEEAVDAYYKWEKDNLHLSGLGVYTPEGQRILQLGNEEGLKTSQDSVSKEHSGLLKTPSGQLFLKKWAPWTSQGNQLGYFELTQSTEGFLHELKEDFATDFVAVLMGPDTQDIQVSASTLDQEVAPETLKVFAHKLNNDPLYVDVNKTGSIAIAIPLIDVEDVPIGKIVILRDVSKERAVFHRILFAVTWIGLALMGALFWFFRRLIGRLENELNTSYSALETEASERKKAQKRAEQASSVKSQFLANMSHELKTPINAITGSLSLLEDSEVNAEHVRTIENASKHLLGTIDQILDIQAIEEGTLATKTESFSPQSLLDELRELFAVQAHQKGITLDTQIDEKLPKQLRGDAAHIRQILMNLLSNAVKFTQGGSVQMHARCVETQAHTAHVQFIVKDSGPGIPEDFQEQIFKAFEQADSSHTRRHEGLGLGLSISYGLARLMSARLELESQKNQGSTFTLSLQLAVEENAPQAPSQAIPSDLSILVVEDNPVNQRVLVLLLAKHGLHCDTANNGQEALDLWQQKQHTLVLMDLQMPIMDGQTAALKIREISGNKPVKIVAVSAADSIHRTGDATLEGFDAHLAKPINKVKLTSTISTLLSH